MKKVTIFDIAAAAGVSNATVSRAICGKPGVGEETRARVLQLCREMGYASNYVSPEAFVPRSGLIGLIVPSLTDWTAAALSASAEKALAERGFSVLIACSQGDARLEAAAFDRLAARHVDGVLLMPADGGSRDRLAAQLERVQTVFLSENLLQMPESYVASDARYSGLAGVEYLFRLGHERILLFGCCKGKTAHRLLAEGYAAACEKYALPAERFDNPAGEDSVKVGERLASTLLAESPGVHSALLCASENMALGVLLAARRSHINVPEALCVLAADATALAAQPLIGLTALHAPVDAMALAAVDMLLDLLKQPVDGYFHRIFRSELIERTTCAKK